MCKRFAALACSPELLQAVEADVIDSSDAHSLTAWLTRHRQHVRRLHIGIDPEAFKEDEPAAVACLAVAGTAGGLAALEVQGCIPGWPLCDRCSTFS